ncbi:hypothetical protein ACE6H2_015238 [Prunus campanulata]
MHVINKLKWDLGLKKPNPKNTKTPQNDSHIPPIRRRLRPHPQLLNPILTPEEVPVVVLDPRTGIQTHDLVEPHLLRHLRHGPLPRPHLLLPPQH